MARRKGMVLITGCNSLVGRTLAGRLMEKGLEVRGFDLWKSKETPQVTEFIAGSILDYELLLGACEGVDTVYHLLDIEYPSQYGRRFMKKVNVRGTDNLLSAAVESKVRKFVFLSSAKVYGKSEVLPISEEFPLKPNTAYGKDKLKAERLCREVQEEGEMDITIFRSTTIAGPGLDDPMILVILYMAMGLEDASRLYIVGDGDSRFQLVHPVDVVDALVLGANALGSAGRTYNLGSDNVPTQSDEVIKVKELAKLNCEVRHITPLFAKVVSFITRPLQINYLRKEHLVFILSNFMLDCEKVKKELGWKPKKDDIQIFVETIDWYRKEKL
jgi:nucleoside-diphosphate-sugar epimerase